MPTLTYSRFEDYELLLEAQLEYPFTPLELTEEISRRGLLERLAALLDQAHRSPR